MVEGTGDFDRANATGKLTLNSSAPSLARSPADRPVCAGAGGAAQCHGHRSGPGASQARARSSARRRGHADRANARAVGRPRCAAAQGRRHLTAKPASRQACATPISTSSGTAKSASSQTVVGAGRCVAGPARARSCDRSGRWSGTIPRVGDRRMGHAAAAESQDSRERAWTPRRKAPPNPGRETQGGQGQSVLKAHATQSRAAVRSQAVGQAGAEYQPVVAGGACRRQADLRRYGRRDGGFAAARAHGADARRGTPESTARSASTRSILRRPSRSRSAPPGAMRPSRSAQACCKGWRGHIAFQALARRAAGRRRIAAASAAPSRVTASR